MPNPHVIFHKADFDGLMSGAITRQALESINKYEPIKMTGWDYGMPIPETTPEETLYMVDISIDGLMDHPNLIWIDHHKTAIEKFDPKIKGYRIDGVAACRLCWQFFHYDADNGGLGWTPPTKDEYVSRSVKEPRIVRLAGEYDVWDLRDHEATTLQFGLRAFGFDELSDVLEYDFDIEHVLQDGALIENYSKQTKAKLVKDKAHFVEWRGLNFLCLNGTGNSQTFDAHPLLDDADALMMWSFNGQYVTFSLYHTPTRKEIDLSEIAKSMGGGGHKGACGFQTDIHAAATIVYAEVNK